MSSLAAALRLIGAQPTKSQQPVHPMQYYKTTSNTALPQRYNAAVFARSRTTALQTVDGTGADP
jgi:hypothetical protein